MRTAIGKGSERRWRREEVLEGQAIESRSPTPDRTLQKIAAASKAQETSSLKPAEKKQRRSQSPSRSRSRGEKIGPRRQRTRSRGRAHDDGRMSGASLVEGV